MWARRAYPRGMSPRSGERAEQRAVWWYRLRGYRILATNAWVAGYELDIVVRRGRRLVFCDHKAAFLESAPFSTVTKV